ncbi:MAG: hypothetical protein Q7S55_01375 [Nanoarchaeota archaeon]|nr:hypothetical protein [Nanoarchaeota archaeon]
MIPIDTDYAIIPFDSSVKIGAYVFNGDVGSCGGLATTFYLGDGRKGVGTPYFGIGLSGLVSKLLGESPKPKLKIRTKHPYALISEVVDNKTLDEIKDLLTLKCADRDCGKATPYAVRFILWEAMGCSRGKGFNACSDHLNDLIDVGREMYSNEWRVLQREFPIQGSREKELGRIRL